jgi:hypothetical protein
MEVAHQRLQEKMDAINQLEDTRKHGLVLIQMVVIGESMEDATEALVYSRDVISRLVLEPHAKYFGNTSKALMQCRVNSWTRAQACSFFINLHKAIWLDMEDIQYNLG